MEHDDDITSGELTQRVVYALLHPPVRVANALGLSLRQLSELVETAYFQEVRAEGATLDAAAERLGISRRTASRLATQLRERFLLPELRHNLPRRLEFMLSAEPLSATRLKQLLADVDGDDIDAALAALVEEGRVELVAGRTPTYRPAAAVRKLQRDTWVKRIGGLTSLAGNVADAAYGRFFKDDPRSFARTLSFRVAAGAEARLTAWYESALLPMVVAADQEADEVGEATSMQLSLCWAPYELIREPHTGETEGAE
ncbi:MAG: hypothetical protein H6700_02685 [Myxococcales bacterium]|nr:hypothetical protein [Myxococcales bacterium]MCB9519630.1 hypothetical protein [Myxococcales bacterium]MCB9530646.1 hypothetical protein [Myxococcales bacterium]